MLFIADIHVIWRSHRIMNEFLTPASLSVIAPGILGASAQLPRRVFRFIFPCHSFAKGSRPPHGEWSQPSPKGHRAKRPREVAEEAREEKKDGVASRAMVVHSSIVWPDGARFERSVVYPTFIFNALAIIMLNPLLPKAGFMRESIKYVKKTRRYID